MAKEYGKIGQKRWNGSFYEEFLPELRGKRGVEVYREMYKNDDVVGAIMFAIKMLMRQATWKVTPASGSAKDKECAEFVESCMHDMDSTWTDTLSEISSFLVYGWSFHEIVYKRRSGSSRESKFSDGLIGWKKIPIRSQDTLYQWEYDKNDNLTGMTQMPPPDYTLLTIPMKKAMLFRTESDKDNPEGRSILRNAYRAWYFKRRIQEIEAIGIERDLAGLPVITAPEGLDIWDGEDAEAQKIYAMLVQMVKNIRRNEYDGLVLPSGYKAELLSAGGSRQFDTNAIINRYDSRIAMTVLADFVMLGHESTGSFALSSDKTELFATAIGTFLDIICETFNRQAIPQLIDLNAQYFGGITDYPTLTHGDIERQNVKDIASSLKEMIGTGVIVPDEELENHVRELMDLPAKSYSYSDGKGQDIGTDRTGQSDDISEEEIEKARKRLGRC